MYLYETESVEGGYGHHQDKESLHPGEGGKATELGGDNRNRGQVKLHQQLETGI